MNFRNGMSFNAVFLFSGWKRDCYKCLYFDGDSFALLYKRLDQGRLQQTKDEETVKKLKQHELRWLPEGLSLSQPKEIPKSKKSVF